MKMSENCSGNCASCGSNCASRKKESFIEPTGEFNNIKHKNFLLFTSNNFFTDDSVITFAIYSALKKCKGKYKREKFN